jgi:hypothetical protein
MNSTLVEGILKACPEKSYKKNNREINKITNKK